MDAIPVINFRKWATKHGISAWNAHMCCVKARSDASRGLSAFADFLAGAEWKQMSVGEALVMQPGVRLAPGLKLGPLLNGTVMMEPLPWYGVGTTLGWTDDGNAVVGEWEGRPPRTLEELQPAISAVRCAANALRRTATQTCEECIRARSWKQAKPRRRVSLAKVKPLTGDGKLMLRIPHA